MTVFPVFTPLARPVLLTVATEELEEAHVTTLVKLSLLPSVRVPVATNCWAVPLAMEAFEGDKAMEDSAADVTVKDTEPTTEPDAA